LTYDVLGSGEACGEHRNRNVLIEALATVGSAEIPMTLVLTELSKLGIAMAADTALLQKTPTYDTTQLEPRVYHGAMKLRPIPKIKAGVSVWGDGRVGTVDTDIWLREFIVREEQRYDDLQSFASVLREKLNNTVDPLPTNQTNARMGFHLAGFEDTKNGKQPCFYHIHNGTSQFFNDIDPRIFNANFDRPPQAYSEGQFYITRNGDYILYMQVFGMLEQYFNLLRSRGLRLPFPENLRMRAEYLRFQIRTVSEIYLLSNTIPWIGGQITTLTIRPEGIESYETREDIVTP
jgi:hypothetical protein